MELEFLNGNDVQKAACRTAAHNLLNLPFESVNLKHTIEFTSDPLPSSHNEFAVTNWSYDSTEPLTKIASVAPAWPEPWRGAKFLQEVYAHELGHGFFASLPEGARLAIAEMFGVGSDDVDALFPPGRDWEDKPGEGIAETFKDAFLPRRFRRYANRTNHTIPIHKYPEFRALWREAVPEVSTGAPLGPGETAVPAYNFDYLAQGEPLPLQGYSPPTYLEGTDGKHGVHSTAFVDFGDDPFGRGRAFAMTGESITSAWVKHGTDLAFTFHLDDGAFPDSQNELRFDLLYHSFVPGFIFPKLFSGRWLSQLEDPEFPRYYEEEADAIAIGDPPFTYTKHIPVNSLFTKTLVCNSTVYRFVELVGFIRSTYLGSYTQGDHQAVRAAYYYPYVPELRVFQSACPPPVASGEPIILPVSEVETIGQTSGRRLKDPTIVGRNR